VLIARASDLNLRRVLGRDEMIVAVGEGQLSGDALACALHSDWLMLASDARLIIGTPRTWSGVIWRMGRGALALLLMSDEEKRERLADLLVPPGRDPLQWAIEWVGARSAVALDAAANLIRRRGGDVLERAEFARLFAAGEPQRGLAAFLNKRMRTDR
jgi:hypothetical protein